MTHGTRGGRVPDSAVAEVLGAVSIEAVVRARGIDLRGAGAEKVGLCPFHDDTHASLGVNGRKGIYKCFSCGAGGDALDFVMEHDRVDFRAALADLAQMGGVDVPELRGGGGEMTDEQRARLEARRAEAARAHAEREAAEREAREFATAMAVRVFEAAPVDHGGGLAAQYLVGRGVDVASAWTGGFCTDVRGGEGLADGYLTDGPEGGPEWRAMRSDALVALLRDAHGRPVGVQRIYLERRDGAVRKRAGEKAKLMLGSAGVCRLTGLDGLEPGEASGLWRLVLAEGIETAAAVLAALRANGVPCGVWAALSTSGLMAFDLPPELVGLPGVVTIAADLDRSGAGERAAIRCAERLLAAHPGVRVRIALPSREIESCMELFDEDGGPAAKSVDWLDVTNMGGASVVADAIVWTPEFRPGSPAKVPGGAADEAAGGGGGDRDGGGAVDGSSPGDGGPRGRLPFTQHDHLLYARNVLLDLYAPDQADRANSRWMLAWHDDRWYRRLPGESRWREDDERRVHAQVWQQLRSYLIMDRRSKGDDGKPRPKRLAPTAQMVRGVMEAMIAECAVFAEQLPAWAPPTFDRKGEAVWGRAAHEYDDRHGGIDPRSAIATKSGILDADAFAQGELRVQPLTPCWLSTGTLPHELPYEEIRAAIDDSAADAGIEGDELFAQLCPTWLAFLRDITSPYAEDEDDDKWIMGLQEWFGYLLTYDTRMETIGLMTGPTRSGKGTVQTALRAILGPGQIASSTFQELASRWKPLELRSKPVCIMPDASIGRHTDAIACAERLKNIRGGDPLSIERHNRGFQDAVVVPTRVFIFVNELPKLPDSAGALAGSMINWPTSKSFEGKEDRTLKARIAAEGAGIMVWALFGLRRLRRLGGFTRCRAGESTLEDLRALGSPVYRFVTEECYVGPGQAVATKVLHQVYTAWASGCGMGALGEDKFGAQLRVACPTVKRVRLTHGDARPYVYVGIRPATGSQDSSTPMTVWDLPGAQTQGRLEHDDWAMDR